MLSLDSDDVEQLDVDVLQSIFSDDNGAMLDGDDDIDPLAYGEDLADGANLLLSSQGSATPGDEEKKKSTKTKRADRKAALLNKVKKEQPVQTVTSSSDEASAEREDGKVETKEDKKQRRLIRNRMSAQLHRERKKAYVDHLEGLVKERDDEIAKLKEEVANLRERLDSAVVSIDGGSSSSEEHDSDAESVVSRKRPRPRGTAASVAFLAAVSCIAVFTNTTTTSPAPYPLDSENQVVSVSRGRRALLSDAPFAEEEPPRVVYDDFDPTRAYLPDGKAAMWGYDRDVEAELFAFAPSPPAGSRSANTVRRIDAASNNRSAHLRGTHSARPSHRRDPGNSTTSLAPYTNNKHDERPQDSATSYVVCSSAAGVFGRGDDHYGEGERKQPQGALLSLPTRTTAPSNSAFTVNDDFIQLLVPSNEIDLRPWGYASDTSDLGVPPSDLWLEIGAELRYGRLVSNINIHPS